LAPTDTLEESMVVPLDTLPLPNQSGDQALVFNDPVLNSSSKTMVVGAPALAGALGTVPAPVIPDGELGANPAAMGVRVGVIAVPLTATKVYPPVAGSTTMPVMLSLDSPAVPENCASPNVKMPPSLATNQYPLPSGVGAIPAMGLFRWREPVDP
jgi:hypothetical protein